ncbi:MAG: hypothetical protein D6717_08660 [Gammaproteobacteria bacterium]|nr:MAG: hypothetical protein D6717_08660 [Gammaproteobacteria bacterium]
MNAQRIQSLILFLVLLTAGITPLQAAWRSEGSKEALTAQEALQRFRQADSKLERFFREAYGYAIFPAVGKGGFIIGGGFGGNGRVYERGRLVGTADVTMVSVGPQIGGQKFSELIFFQDRDAMERFKKGQLDLSAQVSAVMAKEGASADANYQDGVAIFTLPLAGAMAEVSVGGQFFKFKPLKK